MYKKGDVIDLGNRPLEIIELPGHTPGSIGILDVKTRALFAGVKKVAAGEIPGKKVKLFNSIEVTACDIGCGYILI